MKQYVISNVDISILIDNNDFEKTKQNIEKNVDFNSNLLFEIVISELLKNQKNINNVTFEYKNFDVLKIE